MDTILNLFAPWIIGGLALIAGVFGIQSWSRGRKVANAQETADKAIRRAESMETKGKVQDDAQAAARGVKPQDPADPKKRGGLRGAR